MNKLKLKSYVVPTLSLLFLFGIFATSFFMQTSSSLSYPINYVTDIILGNQIQVIDQTQKVMNPYTSASVTVGKTFYDYESNEEEQTKAITRYDDTYMQNSGVDYVSKEVFEVISILDGEVINVTKDENLGNIVKIQHDNEYVSVYQSLSEVTVKKGDKVNQGEVIGKSGTNKLDESLGNHLHFELFINNQIVNPQNYLNKSIDNKNSEE